MDELDTDASLPTVERAVDDLFDAPWELVLAIAEWLADDEERCARAIELVTASSRPRTDPRVLLILQLAQTDPLVTLADLGVATDAIVNKLLHQVSELTGTPGANVRILRRILPVVAQAVAISENPELVCRLLVLCSGAIEIEPDLTFADAALHFHPLHEAASSHPEFGSLANTSLGVALDLLAAARGDDDLARAAIASWRRATETGDAEHVASSVNALMTRRSTCRLSDVPIEDLRTIADRSSTVAQEHAEFAGLGLLASIALAGRWRGEVDVPLIEALLRAAGPALIALRGQVPLALMVEHTLHQRIKLAEATGSGDLLHEAEDVLAQNLTYLPDDLAGIPAADMWWVASMIPVAVAQTTGEATLPLIELAVERGRRAVSFLHSADPQFGEYLERLGHYEYDLSEARGEPPSESIRCWTIVADHTGTHVSRRVRALAAIVSAVFHQSRGVDTEASLTAGITAGRRLASLAEEGPDDALAAVLIQLAGLLNRRAEYRGSIDHRAAQLTVGRAVVTAETDHQRAQAHMLGAVLAHDHRDGPTSHEAMVVHVHAAAGMSPRDLLALPRLVEAYADVATIGGFVDDGELRTQLLELASIAQEEGLLGTTWTCRLGAARCAHHLTAASDDPSWAEVAATEAIALLNAHDDGDEERAAHLLFEVAYDRRRARNLSDASWQATTAAAVRLADASTDGQQQPGHLANAAAILLRAYERELDPSFLDAAWHIVHRGLAVAEPGSRSAKHLASTKASLLLSPPANAYQRDIDAAIGTLSHIVGELASPEDFDVLASLAVALLERNGRERSPDDVYEAKAIAEQLIGSPISGVPPGAYLDVLEAVNDAIAALEGHRPSELRPAGENVDEVLREIDLLTAEGRRAVGDSDLASLRAILERATELAVLFDPASPLLRDQLASFMIAGILGTCGFRLAQATDDHALAEASVDQRRLAVDIAYRSSGFSREAVGSAEGNLANALRAQASGPDDIDRLDESIELSRRAIGRAFPGSREWIMRSDNLSQGLLDRYTWLADEPSVEELVANDFAICSVDDRTDYEVALVQVSAGRRALQVRQRSDDIETDPRPGLITMSATETAKRLQDDPETPMVARTMSASLLIEDAAQRGDVIAAMEAYGNLIGRIRELVGAQRATSDQAVVMAPFEGVANDAFCVACRAGRPDLAVEVVARAQAVHLSLVRNVALAPGSRRDPERIRDSVTTGLFVGADAKSGFAVVGGAGRPWTTIELPRCTSTRAAREIERVEALAAAFATPVEDGGDATVRASLRAWADGLERLLDWIGQAVAAPIAKELVDVGPVVVFATGALRRLPLHAARLPGPAGQHLLEITPVVYGAGIGERPATTNPLRAHSGSGLLLFPSRSHADGLRALDVERHVLRGVFPNLVERTGDDPESIVLRDVGEVDHIHFAGHSVHDPLNPMESYLDLGSQRLTAAHLARVPMRARSALLSSCQSAAIGGRLPDEAFGLVAALHAAGCDIVIGAQWLCLDRTAADIAGRLYRTWDGSKDSLPEALRQAQISMILRARESGGQAADAHPLFWAAYRSSVWLWT